jgi:alkylation response protein AidB-like acyl-CoA dehydrogenase
MDFEQTPEGLAAAELAASILDKHATPDRLRIVDKFAIRFDYQLWRQFAESQLISLAVPEEQGGSALGILEACSVLIEMGRTVAPIPLATHLVTGMTIARFGSEPQKARWLRQGGEGELMLTPALTENGAWNPVRPTTTAENDGSRWLLTGSKTVVPVGPLADLFVVPAWTSDGLTVFLVHADDPGVVVTNQELSGGELGARIDFDRSAMRLERVLGVVGDGEEIVRWLGEHLTVALCAQQLGTLEGGLKLTSEYAKTREQFGRPIGTFQAVSQRLADSYIDVLGARLTMWQAAWRLSLDIPATEAVAIAKLWAADAGHRVAHTTVHVHGGVGIDLDGEAHRYFTAAKRLEFLMGGATEQARCIGSILARDTA